MFSKEAIKALLKKEGVASNNIILLKKFLFCVHYGWFRINGVPPDNQFSLGEYLFDNERVVIDLTRLSNTAKKAFRTWFLEPHLEEAQAQIAREIVTNLRGQPIEVELRWSEKLINFLFYRKKSLFWSLQQPGFSQKNQLKGIKIWENNEAYMVEIDQSFATKDLTKYHLPERNSSDRMGNTKSLILTDKLVSRLLSHDLASENFDKIVSTPHPFSIDVNYPSKRLNEMLNYRQALRVFPSTELGWYKKLWNWIKQCFSLKWIQFLWVAESSEEEELTEKRSNERYKLFLSEEKVAIYQHNENKQILVMENRPDLRHCVFCGGGIKIFAHVGAMKALEEAGIRPSEYAGSSAGAIMAMLCYLGYSSQEVLDFFQSLHQDNLMYFLPDTQGFSDSQAIKAALDFMIMKKISQLINKYQIDETIEGEEFLLKNIFNNSSRITFQSLHLLKKRYPTCGIGDNLIVTATHVANQETCYFSFSTTPDTEISKAVTASASLPIVFKPTVVNGESHKDGGILNNFPTEVFSEDSTLLESNQNNCLSLIAFQFDNGYENDLVNHSVDRVYRENFAWNWWYEFLSGVKNPVKGWENDRFKLLQYSNQVVLLPVNNISSTQFNIPHQVREVLIENGYRATRNHLEVRYCMKKNEAAFNDELIYENFSSIEELVYFCCYRQDREWFNKIAPLAMKEGMSKKKIQMLEVYYFDSYKAPQQLDVPLPKNSSSLKALDFLTYKKLQRDLLLFVKIYPIIHKLPLHFINAKEQYIFKEARHAFSPKECLSCLQKLNKIKGRIHVLLYIFIYILTHSQDNMEETFSALSFFDKVIDKLNSDGINNAPEFLDRNWSIYLDTTRSMKVLLFLMEKGRWKEAQERCLSLKEKEEPLLDMNTIQETKSIAFFNSSRPQKNSDLGHKQINVYV